MKVLFLSDGLEAPGPRYRFEQFFGLLAQDGIQATHRYAYGRNYNNLVGSPFLNAYRLVSRVKRGLFTLQAPYFDLAIVQRTAIPHTAVFEKAAAALGGTMVLDFDDSIFLAPDGSPSVARNRAFRSAVSASTHIIAGNQFLAREANAPQKTTIIPTVIDTDRYTPAVSRADTPLTIGWMGTMSNFPFLAKIADDLKRVLQALPNAQVKIVSNARLPELEGVSRVEQVRWQASREIADLQSFDIGLMPLDNNKLAEGKCSFKLIQYLSTGIPVVGSAVGTNRELLSGDPVGHALSDYQGWFDAIVDLAENPERRAEWGARGRKRIEEKYSVRSAYPKLRQVIENAVR